MVGDVNLFFNDADGDMRTAEIEVRLISSPGLRPTLLHAAADVVTGAYCGSCVVPHSVQVMIAERGSRRRGLAATALQMLMAYASLDLVRKGKGSERKCMPLSAFRRELQ